MDKKSKPRSRTLKALERGTIKAFREYLNAKFAGSEPHWHGGFRQRTRGYGDYLYYQDRAKFDWELAEEIKSGWTSQPKSQ